MAIERSVQDSDAKRQPRKRRHAAQVPDEGADGVFSKSWFPICPSYEVTAGQVLSKSFLDGRVMVYRGDDSSARVQSAWCPHLGADLAVGSVVGTVTSLTAPSEARGRRRTAYSEQPALP